VAIIARIHPVPGPKDKNDLVFSSYSPSSFSVLEVDCNEIRDAWGVDTLGDRGDQYSFVFNFNYVLYSMHFRFHQVSKKATFLLRGKVQRIVRCASPF
jgi:hypothetical protein